MRTNRSNIIFKTDWKAGIIGFCFGFVFPIISLVIVCLEKNYKFSIDNCILIHKENILLGVIDLAPFVLGTLAYFAARKINNFNLKLTSLVEEQSNNIIKLADFAEQIGQGNLDAVYEVNGTDDDLGKAIIQMKSNIKNHKEEDEKKNWISLGRAKITEVIREGSSLNELAYDILVGIIEYNSIIQGAVFLASEDLETWTLKERREKVKLTKIAHYAYGRKKYAKKSYLLGEGLIGEAAIEGNIIHRTEIPDSYMTISSGLIEDKKPKALLIVPLITNNTLQGVIELASLTKFTASQIELIESVSSIIARIFFDKRTTENTQILLTESQQMTTELKSQQAELRANAVEMLLKREEIKKANKLLKDQIKEIKNAQKKQHSLLENSSEVIAIYDETGTVVYESPSIINILGYTPEEMIGSNLFTSNSPSKTVLILRDLFNYIKDNPNETKIVKVPYQKKNGEAVVLEALAKNLIKEEAVKGIVINFRDITERLLAETEQIMRGKMQALSENSGDIILRFDMQNKFQYANPTLSKFTKFSSEEVKGKYLKDISFTPSLLEGLENVLIKVKEERVIIMSEVSFKSSKNETTMTINAIPEFDADKKLETILLVAHDITKRKEQENILAQTNKQIKASINYAKRIQDAIIPKLEDIKIDLGNALQFYKPKDVVSGDFPYYYKKGNYVYYAAVDCTGHGVPGAMMSLIGHLLLNDILNDDNLLTPSQVLSKLHWGVVKTLKQDREENKASDGMDVALCRIDLRTNDILYSGAHRPLYYVKNNEIIQFKGNKFPIGGSQYKGKNNYSDHQLKVEKGESIFFFSDGLPDQFGGPEQLKYGPKRIRNGILENIEKSPKEIEAYFSNSFNDWKGTTNQTDDVLLIGIKF